MSRLDEFHPLCIFDLSTAELDNLEFSYEMKSSPKVGITFVFLRLGMNWTSVICVVLGLLVTHGKYQKDRIHPKSITLYFKLEASFVD